MLMNKPYKRFCKKILRRRKNIEIFKGGNKLYQNRLPKIFEQMFSRPSLESFLKYIKGFFYEQKKNPKKLKQKIDE